MTDQQFKDFCQLNLYHSGLKLDPRDKETVDAFADNLNTVFAAKQTLEPYEKEMEKRQLSYRCMSLGFWALVCCGVLVIPFLEYLVNGSTSFNSGLMVFFYVLTLILLIVRSFFGFCFMRILPHMVLTVICALLTLLRIRIFGSEINWYFLFVFGGALLTIIVRLWDRKKVRADTAWYNEHWKKFNGAEAALRKMEGQFSGMSNHATQQMQALCPSAKLKPRKLWCDPHKTSKLTDGATDFRTKKKDYAGPAHEYNHSGDDYQVDRDIIRRAFIENQWFGYEDMDLSKLEHQIKYDGLVPFFGMNPPDLHQEGLKFKAYVHHWEEMRFDIVKTTATSTSRHYTGARSDFEDRMKATESYYLGTTADIAKSRHDANGGSHATSAALQDYLDKKQAKLDSLSDYNVTTTETHSVDQEQYRQKFHLVGAVIAYAADDTPVGLYCKDNRHSIELAAGFAHKLWGALIAPTANPSTKGQIDYLHEKFLY